MSEEVKKEVKEEKAEVKKEVREGKVESKEEEKVQFSQDAENEIEEQARDLGWKPKEEFEADPKNVGKVWRSAEDFLDRKTFFDKIEAQNRKIKQMERGMAAMAAHNKRIGQLAYEKALRELRAEREKAIEEQDLKKIEDIRDRMEALKESQKSLEFDPVQQSTEPQQNEQFLRWVEKNKWYTQDPDMKAYADGYAIHLWNSGIRDPEEALPMVEKKVKEIFPAKFRNPNKDRAPMIEGGQRKDVKKPDNFTLTEEEEKILETMLRAGAPITREEYIKQLKAYRG